ncbi:glyoxylate/hydroxypyruvate reductase A [Octadecabacter sp. 1_MG-2023]|uniref:2-hydroxyacid dehydrogenase n=1 Tax=unclassified Octadecabacter TaxID=196158 RepID=UPI001C09D310|nr:MULTISPECIES: glyoxylate/hydroxypyruvate reductase A [unclassified Octadecabacter]MBU2994433.1 glyoxylate/hydroxypyruvate reductase A [Octadecabacter sp. B2R22]MDO6734276.1 glyoxylate/hydroxypyruvate reductase A [Octadecabacter sp. 1_MG-2023]
MINALFSASDAAWPDYSEALPPAFEKLGLNVDLSRDHPPETVDYIIAAPNGPVQDFAPFTRCKAVLNLWAGVEDIAPNPTLTQPLARMVDKGLTDGMVEWVVAHTMRHHMGIDQHINGQDGIWRTDYPPLASDRPVTILGLGELGVACAKALRDLGFPVSGWSRSQKAVDGVTCHSGDDGLHRALTDAEILILLLPLTDATTNIINAETLALLAKGAFIINPGRGPLIDDDALIAALGANIAHATLDVFRTEPLPENHVFWAHPLVTVTPHIASTTRPKTAANCIAENMRRGEDGKAFLHLVDRSRGY